MHDEQKRLEFISRIVIFLPLIVIFLGFYMQSAKQSKAVLSEQISPTIATQEQQKVVSQNSQALKLDLNGPYRCQYNGEKTTVDVSIKDKKVFVTYIENQQTTNILLNGDCGYKWEQNATQGDKMCNVGQYISMAEMLTSMNLLSMDSILSWVGNIDSSLDISSSALTSIANTCKKEPIEDTIFSIPTAIMFTDMNN
ncbi:MAG TPA: hypothetical protein PLS49_04685 [Candidatus Woesebacteria bacterium]|nr:hypothetical protein [Candidatus Woesebacteria bacterium]